MLFLVNFGYKYLKGLVPLESHQLLFILLVNTILLKALKTLLIFQR